MEIKKLEKEKIDLNNQIFYLNTLTLNLKNEISNLKNNKTDNLGFVNPGEKIMSIQFKSKDKKIDLCKACKNTDLFVRLEEQLYETYPEYKETNNYFICNGLVIKRFKSLEENKIKDSDKIILNKE